METTPKTFWTLTLVSLLILLFLWTGRPLLLYLALVFCGTALFFPRFQALFMKPILRFLAWGALGLQYICSGILYFLVLTPLAFWQHWFNTPKRTRGESGSFFIIPEKKDEVDRFRKMY
jgi:hypothetical protein